MGGPPQQQQQQRTVAVVRVPLGRVARVTALRLGTEAAPATVLTRVVAAAAAAAWGAPIAGRAAGNAAAAATDTSAPLAAAVLGGAQGSTVCLERLTASLAATLAAHRADSPVDWDEGGARSAAVAGGEFTRAAFRLPPLHPRDNLRPAVSDMDVVEGASAASRAERALTGVKCDGCPRFQRQWDAYARLRRVSTLLAAVRARYSIEALALFPEMQTRLGVLRRLGYTKRGADVVGQAAGHAEADAAGGGDGGGGGDDAHAPPLLDVVDLKGRVAAEVSTCDELTFTEMLFEGVLAPLNPAETAALLSALVFEDKSTNGNDGFLPPIEGQQEPPQPPQSSGGSAAAAAGEDAEEDEVPPAEGPPPDAALSGEAAAARDAAADNDGDAAGAAAGTTGEEVAPLAYDGPSVTAIPAALAVACEKLRLIALALGRLQMDAGLELVPSVFVRSVLNFGLLLPVYAWACGVPFARICELTDVSEGTIVRTITGLENTCRELRNAARICGDPVTFRKAEAASACIRRDVIFASSLYLA